MQFDFPDDSSVDTELRTRINDADGVRRGGIQGMSLVPGGRYLVLLYPKWLTLWDMKFPEKPALCLEYAVPEICGAIELLLDGPDTLYLMLINDSTNTPDELLKCERQLLEISLSDSLSGEHYQRFLVINHGTIKFTKTAETGAPVARVHAHQVVFHFWLEGQGSNVVMVIWEYATHMVSHWTTDSLKQEPMEIILSGKHVLIASRKGVLVFEMPEFIPAGEWTSIIDCGNQALREPAALIEHVPPSPTPAHFTSPRFCSNDTVEDVQVISYYVDTEGSDKVWHKYAFHFHPEDLSKSYALPTHVASCGVPNAEDIRFQATGLFDGSFAADIWEGLARHESSLCGWLSMIRWEPIPQAKHGAVSVSHPDRRADPLRFSCDMVPFIPWDEVWSGHGPVSFALCPSSAKALVLWSHTEDDGSFWFWMRHYSFQ
ncbi:hypothetical protein NMY22_g5554 [Coprinellus aureogranulatus]|nr:hypothetical protein NMY22_g5554 [Coprinellus aureogranulatus]